MPAWRNVPTPSCVNADVILRRAALLVLVAVIAVIAVGAGLAARQFREQRVNAPTEQASEETATDVASAPTATAVPKWYTRRLDIPPDTAVWSIQISPDGASVAALSPNPSNVSVCVPDKVGAPVCPTPTPQRVVRFSVNDPPGAITATLTRVADAAQNSGYTWMWDGGLLVAQLDLPSPGAKVGPKTVTLSVIEKDGRITRLGGVQGASVPRPAALSPDARWLAVAELSPQVTFVERHGASVKTVALGGIGVGTTPAWAADGKLLAMNGPALYLVSPSGTMDRVPAPAGIDLHGVASAAPDRTAFVLRATRERDELYVIYADGRWIDAPPSLMPWLTWITSHELLLRAPSGDLQAFDPRAGATRDLGYTMRASDPRILAYSEPYLMWRDGDAGRIHLLDTRNAYDAVVGVTDVVGVQTYASGGFLILHPNGAELLTAADWFARLPPTAAPFTSAAPPKPGTKDPFADIKTLPRLDQMTTGGALEVVSRSGTFKTVRSPDGGWSLKVPADWRGDVGRLRGGDFYSFDPTGRDNGGNTPAPGEVRLSLTLWPDFDRKGAYWLAQNYSWPGAVTSREITPVSLGPGNAYAYRVLAQEAGPGPFAGPSARWYLPHPSFDDRVVEIVLWRADATTLKETERALESLQLFAPVSGPREPILSRAEAIASAVGPSGGKPTPAPSTPERDEAKLVTLKEWERAQGSGQTFTLDGDTPVWVVMRFGDIDPTTVMRGPIVPASLPPARWTWRMTVLDARTGQGLSRGGGSGDLPWWPALRDRAP